MKIAFVLNSANKEIRKWLKKNDLAVIPREIREKYGAVYRFFTIPPHQDALGEIIRLINRNDGYAFVFISDVKVDNIESLSLPSTIIGNKDRNVFAEISEATSFWTKRLYAIFKIFEPMRNRKALLLPYKNFCDRYVKEKMERILSNFNNKSFSVAEELESIASHLRKMEFPKRKGNYQDRYFIDEEGRHFQYGHEKHAKIETGGGKHTAGCFVNSRLRVGIPYESERHYNVSLEDNGTLKGLKFLTCHNSEFLSANTDHLNMFPNDFIVSQK